MLTLRMPIPAFRLLLFIFCCVVLPLTAAGRTQKEAPAAARPAETTSSPLRDEEADHEDFRRLKQVYEQAVNQNQLDLLAPVLHADFFGVMITNEHVRNLEEMKGYWQRIRALMGERGRYTTTLNPERSVIMGDIALARGTSDDLVVTEEGREYRFRPSWSVVLQREGGQWKVLRAQGTMDPAGNEFVRSFVRRAAIQGALIGVVAGLVLGWLFATLFRRFRTRRT